MSRRPSQFGVENTTSALSAGLQAPCRPIFQKVLPRGSDRVRSMGWCQFSKKCPPRGSVRVRTPPRGRQGRCSAGQQGRSSLRNFPVPRPSYNSVLDRRRLDQTALRRLPSEIRLVRRRIIYNCRFPLYRFISSPRQLADGRKIDL